MFPRPRYVLPTACLLALLALPRAAQAHEDPQSLAMMAAAAQDFLSTLTPEQRAKTCYTFDGPERQDWYYVPRAERKGLQLGEMTPEQRHIAETLFHAGLSRAGFVKAEIVMSFEKLVGEVDARAGRTNNAALRDPNRYHVTIFGEPKPDADWGWSLEGHHLSLNFTIVGGHFVASAPMFFGGQPQEVLEGPRKGLRVLGDEEDKARAVLASLGPVQLKKAMLAEEAPRDIFSRNMRKLLFEGPVEGIALAELEKDQRKLVFELIEEYVDNVPDDLRTRRVEEVKAAGEDIHFAWMGSTTRGDGKGYYYRVQAPTFLIEFDNIQNNANHSHSVWREYDGDFGEDLLAEHHIRGHHDTNE